MTAYIPERGDIMHVDLNPTVGQEQQGRRYVFVLSPSEFNRLGMALVAPITLGGNLSRNTGFAVSLTAAGTRTQGIVQSEQLRTIDYRQRRATFVERAPLHIINEVLARAETLVR
jgi:mRNA interferase ChpB